MIGRRSLLLAGLALPASAYGQCVTDRFAEDACRGGVRNTAAVMPPGATLDLSFMTPGVLDPRITFTRASTATYTDATGTMQTANNDTPRWDYDPVSLQLRGLLLEDQRTNGIRNSTMQGAIPGSPGTLPTNWFLGGSPAVTPQVVGTGTENGIPYVDLRFVGTTTAIQVQVLPETTNIITAANGQAWTNSIYIRLVAGTLNGIGNVQLLTAEATAAGALVRTNTGPTVVPTTAPLASQRMVYSVTLTGGGTVGAVYSRITWNVSNGVAIDATFRVGAPQMEQGASAASFIPTTTVAVTRAIDSCAIAPANMGFFTGSPGGSWFAEFNFLASAPSNSRIIGRPDTAGGVSPLLLTATRTGSQNDGVSVATANAGTANAVTKGASAWAAGQAKVCLNGGVVASSAALATGYGVFATSGVRFLSVGAALSGDNTSGWLRRAVYWPRVLTDAEMQQVTT